MNLQIPFTRIFSTHLLILVLATSGGCASKVSIHPNGTLVRHYFGYVRVEVPQADASQPVYVSDVSTLGIRVGNGIGVGYLREKQIVVPLDCRLVILVSNQGQLDDAVKKLSFFEGLPGLCAVVSPTLQSGDEK